MSLFVPPDRWSANEWLIIGLILAGWLYVYIQRRTFPRPVLILLLTAGGMTAMTLDLLLGAPPLDKYDINDNGFVEWFDMLLYLAYPPFGFLFLHGYMRLRTPAVAVLFYIVLFSFFSLGVEWVADSAGIFRNKSWKLSYSFPVYLLAQGAFLLFYRWMRRSYFNTKLR